MCKRPLVLSGPSPHVVRHHGGGEEYPKWGAWGRSLSKRGRPTPARALRKAFGDKPTTPKQN
eukprot:7404251-Alexandrium_andersonii.AAC.1